MLAILAVLGIIHNPAQAQSGASPELMRSMSSQWGWTNTKWTVSDEIQLRDRRLIDAAMPRGESHKKIVQIYRQHANAAQKRPFDHDAAFRWIYASYRGQLVDKEFDRRELSRARLALVTGHHPFENAEWSRLRFLMEANSLPRPQLKPVGEKLLKKYPKDHEVKYHMIRVLMSGSFHDEGKQQALTYAQDLIRSDSKRPSYYAVLGEIYLRSCMWRKNSADARQAISAYQMYLKLAPPDAAFRKQAQDNLKWLQTQR
jgi:hypothetical protein